MKLNRGNVNTFNNLKQDKPVVVAYLMKGCHWCDQMKPEWDNFTVNTPINFSEVSSDEIHNYTPSPKEEVIRGFPTLRLYNKGKLVKEYDGDRSQKDILRFVNKYIKEKKAKKKNLMLVKARKGNKISKKLLNKLKKQRKKTRRRQKKSRST